MKPATLLVVLALGVATPLSAAGITVLSTGGARGEAKGMKPPKE